MMARHSLFAGELFVALCDDGRNANSRPDTP
jgi:hypothetical protein